MNEGRVVVASLEHEATQVGRDDTYLLELEEMAKTRYTDSDMEFMKEVTSASPPPPLVASEDRPSRHNRGQHHRGGRGGDWHGRDRDNHISRGGDGHSKDGQNNREDYYRGVHNRDGYNRNYRGGYDHRSGDCYNRNHCNDNYRGSNEGSGTHDFHSNSNTHHNALNNGHNLQSRYSNT